MIWAATELSRSSESRGCHEVSQRIEFVRECRKDHDIRTQRNMTKFAPRVALITGGGSGIGSALAKQLGLGGTQVVIADTNLDCAQRVAAEAGDRAEAVEIDVTSWTRIEALCERIARQHGHLDLLITCAGVAAHGDLQEFTIDDWRRVIDINVMGTINASLAAYAIMRRQGAGTIVNVGSLSALFLTPFCAPYCTSKAAVSGFSLSLAIEARAHGVDVSLACPGNVRTPMLGWNISRVTPAISSEDAARRILRGAAHKSRIIVFPFYAKAFWYLERLNPYILDPLRRAIIRRTRQRQVSRASE
jgi:NAD(P)-dependent dehydrogenase (short-subunit alcohol dehydrogenase family)